MADPLQVFLLWKPHEQYELVTYLKVFQDFPGGTVDENLPANAGTQVWSLDHSAGHEAAEAWVVCRNRWALVR